MNDRVNDILKLLSQQQPKEGMASEQFMVDFPDIQVAKIYTERWLHTATLLGVTYNHAITPFGDGQFHYRVMMNGQSEDVERFIEFINQSLECLNGQQETSEQGESIFEEEEEICYKN